MNAIHRLNRALLRSLTKTDEAADILAERLEELESYQAKNIHLRATLQSIADETVRHHEHNPISGKDLLPGGYRTILNLAHSALNKTP